MSSSTVTPIGVYRYCFRRTGSWSDAEELTSITFLEAWRARGKAHLRAGSLLPWLLGVATNVDRNRRRAARRYNAVLSRLPSPEAVPDLADASAARLDAEVTARVVLVELNRLPDRDRDVAILCMGQGGVNGPRTDAGTGRPRSPAGGRTAGRVWVGRGQQQVAAPPTVDR